MFAGVLLALFGGDTHALIPLYMIGVFASFTLSQAGMVIRWRRLGGAGWQRHAFINGLGAVVTGVVLLVVAATKAHEGAWIILLLIPIHVWAFKACRRHYNCVADQLSIVRGPLPAAPSSNTVLVLISGVHRSALNALNYARVLSDDVRAVHVSLDEPRAAVVQREWDKYENTIMLVTLISPYRSLREPLTDYIDRILAEDPNGYVTVVLPEFVPARWWHHIFHNQSALLLKAALLFKRRVIVTSVPFHLEH